MAAELDSEKVACDMVVGSIGGDRPGPPAAVGRGTHHCGAADPDAMVRRLAWSRDPGKWFGWAWRGSGFFILAVL